MIEEFEKEFNKLSEKDKIEVNNLIHFMQEKKYHDKQYEELLNQYIEMARDFDKLQSNWNSLREYCEENKYFYSGYQGEDREEDLSIKGVLDKMNELEGKDK